MSRIVGITLIVYGVVSLIGGACLVIAGATNNGSIEMVLGGVICGAFPGIVSIGVGYLLVRKASPFSTTPVVPGGSVGAYLADQNDPREINGRPFEVFYQTPVAGKNGRPSQLTIRLPAITETTLEFQAETWFDRFGKTIGLAREVETEDPQFDDSVYVRGPSDIFAEEYLRTAEHRDAVRVLLRSGFTNVKLTGKEVQAVWTNFDPHTHDRDNLADDTAEVLLALARDLPTGGDYGPSPAYARSGSMQVGLWIFSIAFALMGFFAFIYPPTHGSAMVPFALTGAVSCWVAFTLVAGILLHGSSVSHSRWMPIVLVGIVTIALGGVGSVAAINALGDPEPTETRVETVIDKRISRGRKNSTTYYIAFADRKDPGRKIELSVSSSVYNQAIPGRSKIEVTTGPGLLGVEWLKGHRLMP